MIKQFTLIILLFSFMLSCSEDEKIQTIHTVGEFECDLESTLDRDEGLMFATTDPNIFVGGAECVSTDFARSGQQSVKLDTANLYSLNLQLKNTLPGEFVQIAVWVYSTFEDPTLTAHLIADDMEYRYRTMTDKNDPGENGWRKHYLSFTIPEGVSTVRINVFAGKQLAYFDDFSLKRQLTAPQNDLPNQLELAIPDSSMNLLNNYIFKASGLTTIPASCKKYVGATLIEDKDSARVEMKLKGDWTDHLYSGKESYRIKIKGDLAFEGLKSFSIQHPRTRLYLNEWVTHKIADREDVLTTTYDFVNVKINDIQHGVYALEEHFDKQLLESRNRREGPILKFDETGYWTAIKKNAAFDSMSLYPYFQESKVSCFKVNRTRKSEQLSKQFDEGKRLLQLFKTGHTNIEDIFDVDQLAKYYVIMELSGSGHGLRWHNRRFYYNPISQKLEHIVYDALPFIQGRNFSCIMLKKLNQQKQIRELCFDNAILYNETFKKRYLFYLDQKTQPAYLDALFNEIDAELGMIERAIQAEIPNYHFQKNLYYDNAAYLRSILPTLEATWNKKILDKSTLQSWVKMQTYHPRSDAQFLTDLSVNAYRTKVDSGYHIALQNFHTNTVTIQGYSVGDTTFDYVKFEVPISLNGFVYKADTAEFFTAIKPKKIYFTVSNNPSLLIGKKFLKWEKPVGGTVRMRLKQDFIKDQPYYSIVDDAVVFKGNIVIDTLLYIPSRYLVRILPGAQIEFKTGGGIIANNSFYAEGTATNPIRVFCNDSTSNGLTILNGKEAVFSHCLFEGLSNLNYQNWELTGAISIYETSVMINECSISGNHSEDGLNIIRSNFSINALNISETFSDAFDADFCSGIIENSMFLNTGNDCIDFSGSIVTINDIVIENSGDKGISGGEGSNLKINNITINGAITGIAAKDGSFIEGKDVTIKTVEYALAAFRKKPEYSGANVNLNKVTIQNEIKQFLIELGSKITIDGDTHEGVNKLDIDALYARFE